MGQRTPIVLVSSCLLGLGACGDDRGSVEATDADPLATSRIPIVIEADTLPSAVAELDLRIGRVDDPDYALTDFRLMEVDDEGRMYTLHRSEQVVRRFLPDGTFDGLIGGPGAGPGEFARPLNLGWVGDTLWVFDLTGHRFSYFDPDGGFLRSASIPFSLEPNEEDLPDPRATGLLWDGRIHGEMPLFPDMVESGAVDRDLRAILAEDGSVADTIRPRLPIGRMGLTIRHPNPPVRELSGSQPVTDFPLVSFVPGEDARVVVDRSVLEARPGAAYTVSKISFSGDTLFSGSGHPDPVLLAEEEIDAAMDRWVESLGRVWQLAPAAARDLVEEAMFLPPNRPGIDQMVVARTGEVWLRETTADRSATWIVLRSDGVPEFHIELPTEFMMMVAGESEVWGRVEDELEVPFVVRYRVERP